MKPGIAIAAARAGSAFAALGALMLFTAACAWAAKTPWYQVEVAVFAQGDDSAWHEDDWREEGPPPVATNTVELLAGLDLTGEAAGSKRRHAFRMLPASALDLVTAVDRLDRSDDYRVLLHVGWHQPGFRSNDASGVHLSTLRGLIADDRFAAAPGEAVDGTVRLWRRRFLHVDADVAFGDIEAWRERRNDTAPDVRPRNESAETREEGSTAQDATPPTPEAAANARDAAGAGAGEARKSLAGPRDERLRVARLVRNLRLRAGRLHYIDHPLFGMLLLVKRLD